MSFIFVHFWIYMNKKTRQIDHLIPWPSNFRGVKGNWLRKTDENLRKRRNRVVRKNSSTPLNELPGLYVWWLLFNSWFLKLWMSVKIRKFSWLRNFCVAFLSYYSMSSVSTPRNLAQLPLNVHEIFNSLNLSNYKRNW